MNDPDAEGDKYLISRKTLLKNAAIAAPLPLLLGGGVLVAGSHGTPQQPEVRRQGRLLDATPECDDGDHPTPPQTEGPYFTPNSPERSNLIEAGMSGTRLTVTGFVYSRDCSPVSRCLLDWWQCDSRGVYDNQGYRLRGHFYTDSAGKFTLTTIFPGLYPGRTRHLHVKVQAPNQRILTTQLYFPGEPGNNNDSIFDPRLLMEVRDVSGGREGTFEFVLDIAGTPPTTTTPPPTGGKFENTNNVTIPDLGAAVTSSVVVTGQAGNAPTALKVDVDIKHTWRGDLVLDLIAPDGAAFRLKNANAGDSADNILATYTVNASAKPANGTWKLQVRDVARNDTGYIDAWSLQF